MASPDHPVDIEPQNPRNLSNGSNESTSKVLDSPLKENQVVQNQPTHKRFKSEDNMAPPPQFGLKMQLAQFPEA